MGCIKNKSQFAWIMYDWADSTFATTVMAGFFPLFFKNYWSTTTDANVSTAFLGMANSLASLVVALLAPVLGAIADQGNKRKSFLVFFAYLGALMTGCLFMVESGNWQMAMFLFIMGTIGFSGANIFYDSLLPDVSTEQNVDYVSSKGYAFGYLGGGLLFLLNVLWYTLPGNFGFDVEYQADITQIIQKENQTELILHEEDFQSIDQKDIPALLISQVSFTVQKISKIETEGEEHYIITTDSLWNLSHVSSLTTFGENHTAELVELDIPNSQIRLKNLSGRISVGQHIKFSLQQEMIIHPAGKGRYITTAKINSAYDKRRLKTDLLKPAREYLPIRLSFLSVALWWAVFTLPFIFWVKEKKHGRPSGHYIRRGFGQLLATFHKVRHMKNILIFLLAYWMYIDGVNTFIRMAVDYGMSIGLDNSSLIIALIITQFVGFPSALVFGLMGERWNVKKSLFVGIFIYLLINFWAIIMREAWEFYCMATIIGLVQGGIQALSRSMYSRLIPDNQSAEYFGFLNMTGKFAAILGPALIGLINLAARKAGFSPDISTRIGIGSISLLFVAGWILLYFVDISEGKQAVKKL